MAGRRHHTIPQFMLRAFESIRTGKEAQVWWYRKDCEPISIGVTNISVERDFYGRELDDRITTLETSFAPLAKALGTRTGLVSKPESPRQ